MNYSRIAIIGAPGTGKTTLAKEKWIMDGTYRATLKTRLEAADLII